MILILNKNFKCFQTFVDVVVVVAAADVAGAVVDAVVVESVKKHMFCFLSCILS
jgi:hypothetical protein